VVYNSLVDAFEAHVRTETNQEGIVQHRKELEFHFLSVLHDCLSHKNDEKISEDDEDYMKWVHQREMAGLRVLVIGQIGVDLLPFNRK
jgi:hypothetical protein